MSERIEVEICDEQGKVYTIACNVFVSPEEPRTYWSPGYAMEIDWVILTCDPLPTDSMQGRLDCDPFFRHQIEDALRNAIQKAKDEVEWERAAEAYYQSLEG